jgi:hypothetical protein
MSSSSASSAPGSVSLRSLANTHIRHSTNFIVGDDLPRIEYNPANNVLNSRILADYTLCNAWVQASMIKTGFNTRKTTRKGVRRMWDSMKTNGYMQSNAVVLFPATPEDNKQDEVFALTEEDVKKGVKFLCADVMHRTRCVCELSELKAAGDNTINCGDEVFACILRPDTPRKYLIQLSLSKYLLSFVL